MKARRGFTLLELTVALVIAGIAISAGTAALGYSVDAYRRTSAEGLEMQRVLAIRSTIARWLSSPPAGTAVSDIVFRHDFQNGAERDEVTFATGNATPFLEGPAWITLSLGEGEGLVASLRSIDGVRAVDIPIWGNVTELRVRYRRADDDPGWWIHQADRTNAVQAVSIEIGGAIPASLRIPIIVDL